MDRAEEERIRARTWYRAAKREAYSSSFLGWLVFSILAVLQGMNRSPIIPGVNVAHFLAGSMVVAFLLGLRDNMLPWFAATGAAIGVFVGAASGGYFAFLVSESVNNLGSLEIIRGVVGFSIGGAFVLASSSASFSALAKVAGEHPNSRD